MKKVFAKQLDNILVSLAFNRVSETGRARKVTEYQNQLEKAKRLLRKLEVQKIDYDTRIDERIKDAKEEITEAQAYLTVLHSVEFEKWIETQQQESLEAYAKAEDLLKQFLGPEAYDVLILQGELIFDSQGKTFKVTKEGMLYEKQGEEYVPRCLIRPREIPTPDFVIALLTTLRENPDLWQRR